MIVAICISLIVGAGITYIILKPKLDKQFALDKYVQEQNEELEIANRELQTEIEKLNIKKGEAIDSLKLLEWQLDQVKQSHDKTAEEFYQKTMELTYEKIDKASENLSIKYQKYEEEAQQEYTDILQSLVADTLQKTEESQKELAELEAQLADIRSKVSAATAEAKRHEEEKNSKNFYRVCISEHDKEEIRKLREVAQYLRDQEPLNKVIWKVYYENPTSELIGRLIGSGVHTGIYKITDIESGRCYVGQSANIAERFKQHIKRGLGAETPTKNKLYPAMASIGVENFTFEVIEECQRSQLDEREDYWQEFYDAITFGFSIK